MEPQQTKPPAAHYPAENPQNNVYHHSVSPALHHLSGEPPGDQACHNPRYKSHALLSSFSPRKTFPLPRVLLERALPDVKRAPYTGSLENGPAEPELEWFLAFVCMFFRCS